MGYGEDTGTVCACLGGCVPDGELALLAAGSYFLFAGRARTELVDWLTADAQPRTLGCSGCGVGYCLLKTVGTFFLLVGTACLASSRWLGG